jgi:CHAT domain-containing protein
MITIRWNTIKTITFFLIIAGLGIRDLCAQQRQSHWLVGQWEGHIEGYPLNLNPARTLQVFEVLSDGTVRGRWSITGESTGEAEVKVEGVQVRIMTSADSQVVLNRVRDNLLAGDFTLKNGRRFTIQLTRSTVNRATEEEWIALEREAREAERAGRWLRASTLYRQAATKTRDRGQYQRAIDYANKSLETAVKANAPAQEIRAILQLVLAYRRVRQENRGRAILQKGIDTLNELPAGNDKITLEPQLYKELGWELIRTGEYEHAIQHLSHSLQSSAVLIDLLKRNPKISRSIVRNNENGMSRTFELLGDAYSGAGKIEEAFTAYEKGLELVKDSALSTSAVRIRLRLGQLYSQQNEYSRAAENLQKALSQSENQHFSQGIQRASSQMGNLLRASNKSSEAIPYYEKAIITIEATRASLESEEFRSSYFENSINIYANMIRAQLEQKNLSDAFNYNERARSRAFLDILGSKVQLGRSGTLTEEERLLQAKISELRARLTGQADDSETAENYSGSEQLRQELDATQKVYTEFLAKVRKENKEQASLMNVEPLTLKQVQELLDPGVTLLEYFVSGNNVWLWVVEKDRVQFARSSVAREELVSKVTSLRDTIYQLGEKDKFNALSQELYRLLIEPAVPYIQGKELLVIPHDVLHYLPFQALLASDGHYLIEKYPIDYLSSASLMQFTKEKRRAGGEKVLALGNPDVGDPKMNLQFAEVEAKEIQSLYPQSTIFLEKDATEEKAKALSPQNDIVHFATHAQLNEDDPLSSAVLLAKSDKEDGRLEVREIFGMDLHANLVVLSACETGLGKLSRGDELVGLTRAFIYAGTPSVVASLWSVEDSSTAQLMAGFYKNLKTMSKVEALRQAQLNLIRGNVNSDLLARRGIGGVGKLGETPSPELSGSASISVSTSHPYFWAPFILVGDGK